MTDETRTDILQELTDVIERYNPEYLKLSEDGYYQLDSLLDSMSAFETECNEPDAKEQAIQEIMRECMRP